MVNNVGKTRKNVKNDEKCQKCGKMTKMAKNGRKMAGNGRNRCQPLYAWLLSPKRLRGRPFARDAAV